MRRRQLLLWRCGRGCNRGRDNRSWSRCEETRLSSSRRRSNRSRWRNSRRDRRCSHCERGSGGGRSCLLRVLLQLHLCACTVRLLLLQLLSLRSLEACSTTHASAAAHRGIDRERERREARGGERGEERSGSDRLVDAEESKGGERSDAMRRTSDRGWMSRAIAARVSRREQRDSSSGGEGRTGREGEERQARQHRAALLAHHRSLWSTRATRSSRSRRSRGRLHRLMHTIGSSDNRRMQARESMIQRRS